DPLSLVADILTVAVLDAEAFDALFPAIVTGNAEGRLVTGHDQTGFAFTEDNVAKFASGSEPMQAAGAAVLQLAWQHQALLLGEPALAVQPERRAAGRAAHACPSLLRLVKRWL